MKKGIKSNWKRAVSLCLAFQMAAVTPAGGLTLPEGKKGEVVNTGQYAAAVDVSAGGGSLALFNGSDPSKPWNTVTDELVPGTTMFWDGANGFQKAQITPELTFEAPVGAGAVTGVKLGSDAEGVKTWFLFDDEIVCAGAGVKAAASEGGRLVTVVDTVPVGKDTKLSLTNPSNGYRNVLTASKSGGVWETLLDTATKGVHTQRNWLSASNRSGSNLDWSYVFGSGESGTYLSTQQVYYRLNTKETGIASLAEFFIAPEETYQYTMVAGKTTADYNNNSLYQTDARLLVNTTAVQAAADAGAGMLAIAKWEGGSSRIENQVVPVTLDFAGAVGLKMEASTGNIRLSVAKPEGVKEGLLTMELETSGKRIVSNTNEAALTKSEMGDTISLQFDAAAMGDAAVILNIEGKAAETLTGDEITVIRGQEGRIPKPDAFTGAVSWEVKIPKPDGSFVRNAGSSKIKRELKEGETDGNRKAGDADGSHIASIRATGAGDGLLSAREKGTVTVVATDEKGRQASWLVTVLYEDPANLPQAEASDYEEIRTRWKESLIGDDLTVLDGGAEILAEIDEQAKDAWEAYAYKGQDTCASIPWPADEGAAGNKDVPYEDDAVEFRPAFKKVLAMAKAYAAKGSAYYQDASLLADMKNILNYLCTYCYTPKTQTDNWWTWEIGIPKDILPALVLISNELTPEEIKLYTEALYFFQPDPYHEGIIGTGSTHAQGYRTAQGANIIDCSRTALGLGILREDNELVYLAQKASSETFVIQEVEDSTKIADKGYNSGFYADGSYLDHSHVPYLGSYGIEFLKGGVGLPPLLARTPWDYPREVQENLEFYLKEGFLNGMYQGLMLDSLKGRSVSRPAGSNRAAGREAMSLILQLMNSVSPEVEEEIKGTLKAWIELDPGFLDSLTGAENMAVKAKAIEISEDDSISYAVEPIHRNYPLMDRAIHRTDRFLMALSMYSERIQNTEIMNDENRYGWHQGSGMTYIYDSDITQYTDNFWNTVNPLRLAGTTLVSKDIGTGNPDSSGFAQGGDFRSREAWVGGSSIGTDGINGMSMSGEVRVKEGEGSPSVTYSPEFSAKKSWFMFGDQIVCLGAGITNSGEDSPVETIIENRRLRPEADNVLTVNGEVKELPLQSADLEDIVSGSVDVSGTAVADVSWAHLEGNVEGSDIGYYFPQGDQTVSFRKGKNAGDWSLVGTSEGAAEENYLEMWFDHGSNPENEAYEYVLLPGYSQEETEMYAKEPAVKVLSNTKELQAVSQEDGRIFGANLFAGSDVEIGDVTISGPASVMTKEDEEGNVTIAVADPTMKNTGSITVELKRPVEEILDKDENVEAEITETGVKLTVRTKGTNGSSSCITVKVTPEVVPPDVEKVTALIEKAVETAEISGDYGSDELVKAVREALDAVAAVSNEELAEHCMDELVILEDLYKKVMDALGNSIGFRAEIADHAATSITVEGASLSIPAAEGLKKATASEAVKATASNAKKATPSSATPSSASKSGRSFKLRDTITSVVLRLSEGGLDVQKAAEERGIKEEKNLKFQLYLEYGDGERTVPASLTAPVRVTVTLPTAMDEAKPVTAVWKGLDGTEKGLAVERQDSAFTFILPDNGTVILNGEREETEEIFHVSVKEASGGVITASPMSGKKGTKVAVKAVPDKGYRLEALTVNGRTVEADGEGSYTFTLQEDTVIGGSFKRISHGGSTSSGSSSSSSYTGRGWKLEGGKWYYIGVNGSRTTGWLLENGKWYWLAADGTMQTGWLYQEADGFWYYLTADGSMATGWNFIDGKWYYFAPQTEGAPSWHLTGGSWTYQKPDAQSRPHGAMYSDAVTPDGYRVDRSGSWIAE